jgi:alkylation response protein AidB-like acyl-CoA dehydrogenase
MSVSALSLAGLSAALPDLAAEARARSLEFEDRRNLAPDFVKKLKAAGAFKVLVPAEAGGLGGSLPQFLEFAMAMAEADASSGWVAAHANICAGLIYPASPASVTSSSPIPLHARYGATCLACR